MPSASTFRLEAVSRCPACGDARRTLLHDRLTDRLFGAPGEWTLYRCEACRSAYLDPRPTADTIHLAYREYFTHDRQTWAWGLGPGAGAGARVRRGLSNGYLNARYGTDYRPALAIGRWVVPLVPLKRARLDGFARHLPRGPRGGRGNGRLLDVGCGNGEFLDLARRAGWQVTGLEPDPRAAEAARAGGLDVRVGGIELLADRQDRFDLITLSHVLEHVHEPLDLLRACARLLGPSGCLWIETPNVDARGHARYGRHWRGLEPPRHLVLFNHESLTAALRSAGFGRIERRRPRPVCAEMFAASEAIAGNGDGRVPLRARLDGFRADLFGVGAGRLEFLTLEAWR